MRKIMLFGAMLLSAAVLLAQSVTPLSVKTGLWQVSMTTAINGMPPHANSYQSCLKAADLGKYPFTDPNAKCTWTVVTSTSSTMQANGTCMPANMGTVTFNMQLTAVDSGTVKGTGQMNFNGPAGPISGNYSASAKWVSDTCPANMK